MTKLRGSITTDRRVEIPVIVTLSAKSALKSEHHPVDSQKRENGQKNGKMNVDLHSGLDWLFTHNSNRILPDWT